MSEQGIKFAEGDRVKCVAFRVPDPSIGADPVGHTGVLSGEPFWITGEEISTGEAEMGWNVEWDAVDGEWVVGLPDYMCESELEKLDEDPK